MPAPQRPRDHRPGGPEPAIYPRGFVAAAVADAADEDPEHEVPSATVTTLREARQELAELMARLAGEGA